MKRFHVHVAVENLKHSIEFYSTLFAARPTMEREDYAKWMLDDPRVNFAISARGHAPGVNHLGIQADSADELRDLGERVERIIGPQTLKQDEAACCYAKSDKYWVLDPQGLAWENFHTLEGIPVFGEDNTTKATGAACCIPLAPACKTAAQSAREAVVEVIEGHWGP
ncbi:MAG: glyoxalase/bleomycin resistance/dioxygenase family protein [Sulfuricaulis sp.]|nr:glyoxalase/bleomycin resistance/dioxygenase family protein [Sulfuricaulis sp.]